ncbi:hypothetical protein ACRWUG_22085, partial [Escherichia coli]
MAIFDIEKDELLRLSDIQLEELIARLAEAEVAMHGHSPACVNWSGSITAPDGGIVKWHTEFGHLNRGDMLTSEQHRCSNEKKKFQRR